MALPTGAVAMVTAPSSDLCHNNGYACSKGSIEGSTVFPQSYRENGRLMQMVTEIGAFSMWGASSGSQEKSIVAFKADRLAPGLYKVETNNDLAPGEYCFVATSSVAGAYGSGATFAHDLFDFGVG